MTRSAPIAALAAIAASLGATGCFLDASSPSIETATTAAYTPPAPQVERGCTRGQPYRLRVSDARWEALVHACSNRYGNSLMLRNASDLVLHVWARGEAAPQLTVYEPTAESFVDQMVQTAVRSGWSPTLGAYVLTPGASVVGTGYYRFTFDFKTASYQTVVASATNVVAGAIAARFTTPGQKLAQRIVTCAENVAGYLRGSPYWQDQLGTAVNAVSACGGLLRQAFRSGADPPPPSATRSLVSGVKGLVGMKYLDGLEWVIGKARLLLNAAR